MSFRNDRQEIWEWYEVIKKFNESGLMPKVFCTENNIDYTRFFNMRFRIDYKKYTDPKMYAHLMKLGKKFLESGGKSSEFAKEHKIESRILREVVTHINYLQLIEEIKAEKTPETMKFVQIQHQIPIEENEVIEKKNDLEIIIAKGVKVSISANLDSQKIIKIIELLKDL